eukprot:CAMPEP_0196999038 /NCGR_PEP_ID=MMETSP1380-20130617/4295_1 /TAXON_ID=5936 /ORGANISM="Euplotes crassus, Strain CT5" /LENGTH=301 /DNA_ID=CAMNT_0042415825 /DNA_START=91 /DNA_END=996 /DNA_ORIENTATION=+
MIIDKSRGMFLAAYSFIFVATVPWNLTHGFSDVDDQIIWSELSAEFLQVKKKELSGSKEIYKGSRKCMYLMNHSTMADLFLIDIILESRTSYLARYGVILFCPLPMMVTLFTNSIWFFKRGGRGEDLEPFFQFLDRNFNFLMTSRAHLGCFPEGHRSVKPYMLPLKTGMVRYAYERELLVQPIVAFGIENAMSEYTFRLDWTKGALIEYYSSDIIDPRDYKPDADSKVPKSDRNLQGFHKTVEKIINKSFEENHAKVDPTNNREKYLRDGEERDLYTNAPIGSKCAAMREYVTQKRRKKRH